MRLPLVRSLAVAALALAASGLASASDLTGSVWVAYSDGVEVNANTFTNRLDVYLNGSGLPEGEYYVRVLSTEDDSVLGSSLGAPDETPVAVGADGNFAEAYQLWSLVLKTSDQTQGFDTPVAPWCEYRVQVSASSSFDTCLVDIFIVKEVVKGMICVKKFYDANANGVRDDGEVYLEGWKVSVSGAATSTIYTTSNAEYDAGEYTFTEATPTQSNWVPTTDTSITVTLAGGDSLTVEFGNVCVGAGGGRTPGFWSNKNGQALITSADLAALSALSLVNGDGSAFDPTTAAAVKKWLNASNAVNMAYKLSSQFAAMTLNVRHGFVPGDSLIFAPAIGNTGSGNDYISINDLLAAAEAALAADAFTPTGDPNRDHQEDIKDALDAANNSSFTSLLSTPGTFSF